MKNKLQKAMKIAFALCMAAVMVCSAVTNAQAAGYVKSFTKTASIKGGQQCLIRLECKEAAGMTVTISTTAKKKDLNIQAVVPGATSSPSFTELKAKKKKNSVTVDVDQGNQSIYVTNYATGNVKVKIKVSASGKVLKFVKKETIKEIA